MNSGEILLLFLTTKAGDWLVFKGTQDAILNTLKELAQILRGISDE